MNVNPPHLELTDDEDEVSGSVPAGNAPSNGVRKLKRSACHKACHVYPS